MNAQMTVVDAAALARTSAENVRDAMASGDLRDLRPSTVQKWVRASVASRVTTAYPKSRA